jgi:hypothetical protein
VEKEEGREEGRKEKGGGRREDLQHSRSLFLWDSTFRSFLFPL